MLDLNSTLVFVKVAEKGSLTAAAQELRLPKSTISRKLKELETKLGVQLLHRTTRRLGLSEAGAVYLRHCQSIIRDLDAAESAVERLQSGPRGWLRVAAPPSVGSCWVAPLLGDFHARYPEVQVEMELHDESPDLIANAFDIALCIGPLPDSSLVARRLAQFPTAVYASKDYIATYGEPAHARELSRHRVLALAGHRHADGFQWPMYKDGKGGAYAVRPTLVCNDGNMLHTSLLAGQGLLLACAFSMRDHLASGAVQMVMPGWQGPALELNAVFPRDHRISPKVRVFVDFLVECFSPWNATTRAA